MSLIQNPHAGLTQPDTSITTRILCANDAQALRDIRLHALTHDGRYFTADRAAESARTMNQWAQACIETCDRAMFGAFAGNELVAIMGAQKFDKTTVRYGSAYVMPAFRRSSIGTKLYNMRDAWAAARGFTTAVFTIRADNQRSRDIQEKQGAVVFKIEPLRFADGSIAETMWYKKYLMP
ncbi:MAG: GNAT family N-acetyltransferase [Alphaproteobacteria bacterium]|nr:GNAT family N-acetyltransferase [Alphaproteobacteria bacterium]